MSRKSSSISFWVMIASFAVALSLPAQTFSPWGHTTNLGSGINSVARESCEFVTSSGRSLYFASTRAGGSGGLDLYVAQRASAASPWGVPQNLGPKVNSADMDHLPFITADGHSMIFASTRGNAAGLNDIYVSFRRNATDDFGWETPVVVSEISSSGDEYAPWGFDDPATGGLVLFLASNRTGGLGGYDIYTTRLQADGKFSTPTLVAELSTAKDDSMPAVTADGLEMLLTSDRPGGFGSYDIWASTRGSVSEPWSPPVNLGSEVNTSASEQRGVTWGNATEMYFFSNRTGGGGIDLYRATRTKTTLIPVVGSTKGADGNFVTSATLSNPGETEISGNLVFHPAGIGALSTDPHVGYRLAPYESQALPDVMASIGLTGVGSLEIVPDPGAAPATAFRIHKGATAFVVPPVGPEDVMSLGQHSAVKMPADMNRNRVNVGVRTLASGAKIWVCMHEPGGTYIRGYTREFPPDYLVQMPVADLLGGAVTANQMVMFTVQGGSAVIFVSTVENDGPGSTMEIVRPVDN